MFRTAKERFQDGKEHSSLWRIKISPYHVNFPHFWMTGIMVNWSPTLMLWQWRKLELYCFCSGRIYWRNQNQHFLQSDPENAQQAGRKKQVLIKRSYREVFHAPVDGWPYTLAHIDVTDWTWWAIKRRQEDTKVDDGCAEALGRVRGGVEGWCVQSMLDPCMWFSMNNKAESSQFHSMKGLLKSN